MDLSEKRCNDLNTITSLIKSFLRQLPIPLITYEAYPELIDIAREFIPFSNAAIFVEPCVPFRVKNMVIFT